MFVLAKQKSMAEPETKFFRNFFQLYETLFKQGDCRYETGHRNFTSENFDVQNEKKECTVLH
jgi:hypothetical protein